MKVWRCFLSAAILVLVGMGVVVTPRAFAADPPATWKIALLHVTYSDTTAIYTPAQLTAAAGEIHDYFSKISFGRIDLTVTPVEVTLAHTKEYYFNACTTNPCPPDPIVDAAQAAVAGGFSFSGINGISVLSTFCAGDHTNADITITGISGTFGRSYDFECTAPPPGPSGVLWGGWAHEFGHQLEIAAYGNSIFSWGLGWHPSQYASGYDQMDSCYPCHAGAYSLLSAPIVNGTELVFGGWLNAQNVVVVNAPSPGTTVVLTPLEQSFTTTQANQAIKVPIAKGLYYLVEARQPIISDSLQNSGAGPRGIYDTGVHILKVNETGNPPVTPINSCDTTVPAGCIYSQSDSRISTCNATTRPAYCWPFDLWHVGDTFKDTTNAIEIKVNSAVGDGFEVTVTRGVAPGHAQLFIVPWLTPPMNTYETVDIWVDSSCNGYESVVGPKGLLYGRRADGTVIGNGDDPCANHPNRIYANIHNIGDAPANNIVVHFQVTNPPGVGVTGSWTEVGKVTIPTLAAGASTGDAATTPVFVDWTPAVTLTPAEIAAGVFKFHTCVEVIIDPVADEAVTSGHQAQENFDNFSAVQEVSKNFPPIHGQFFIFSDDRETVSLETQSSLPKDWKYKVANGVETWTVGGNHQILEAPADIEIPHGSPIGQSYELKVQALRLTEMENDAIPPSSVVEHTHLGMMQVGGVTLSARAVLPSSITLTAANSAGTISADGTLDPAESTVVAVDFIDPSGGVFTRYATTNASGHYACSLPTPTQRQDSNWQVRAFWQGNMEHAGAVSPERSVLVPQGDQPFGVPPAYAPCP
jgi:hypothetical protein